MSDNLFNKREQAFEAKYAHDQELDFLAKTRGGAMFAEWVAGLLKLNTDEALRYTHEMLHLILTGQSQELLIQKVSTELDEVGQRHSRQALEARVVACQVEARRAL